MRPKIAIVTLLIFCFAGAKSVLPFIAYLANYQYISEVLCINKDKPMSACKGKCYLNQQLLKAQDSESKEPKVPAAELERIPMIICSTELPMVLFAAPDLQELNSNYTFSIRELYYTPPTPPPKC